MLTKRRRWTSFFNKEFWWWWWWLMKKYGRLGDDAWKNVEDLKECFNSRDTLKTYGFSYLGFVICVCYLK